MGQLNLTDWSEKLQDRLEVMRETGWEASKAVKSRKDYYDRNSVVRIIAVGNLVLYRTPGLNCKLDEVWKGPYVV